MERRGVYTYDLSTDAVSDIRSATVVGIAVPYGIPAVIDGVREIVQRGAFARIIDQIKSGARRVKALVDHNPHRVIGEVRLTDGDDGLRYEIANADIDTELSGASIGFNLENSAYTYNRGERVLTDVDLQEISVLTPRHKPAYPATTANKRSHSLTRWLEIVTCLNS